MYNNKEGFFLVKDGVVYIFVPCENVLEKFGREVGAIGFAVYLDGFERLNNFQAEFDVDYVLIINKNDDPTDVLAAQKELSKNGESVLVCKEIPQKIRYKKAVQLKEGVL